MDPHPHPEFESFLRSLPEGGPERAYHAELGRLVLRVPFDPSSEPQGFGVLFLFSQGRLVTDLVDTDLHAIGGSIEENACLVSALFSAVGKTLWQDRGSPSWWKAKYASRIADLDVQEAAAWWVEHLERLEEVIAVESPI